MMVSKRERERIELEQEEELVEDNPEGQDWDIGLVTKDNYLLYVDRRIACPWCKKARDLLVSTNKNFREIDVSESGVKEMFIRNRHKTVPQIYHDKHYVGGYTDLKVYLGKKS